MFKSMLRRSVPALTLTTILFITCAGTAQARTLTPAEQAWSWLQQVWAEGVGRVWGGGVVRLKRAVPQGGFRRVVMYRVADCSSFLPPAPPVRTRDQGWTLTASINPV